MSKWSHTGVHLAYSHFTYVYTMVVYLNEIPEITQGVSMSTIAVIGGGIVGASAAYHLAKAGVKTILVDGSHVGKATSAGAGIVAPGASLRPLPAFFALAKPAVTYYPTLADDLRSLNEEDCSYEVCGKLMVAETPDKAKLFPELKELFEHRRADGMPNLGDISDITPTEAKEVLPILGNMQAAMYISGAARVDGTTMRTALTNAAQKLGARVVPGDAGIEVQSGKVTGITTDEGSIAVDSVVVSAGAWTNTVLEPSEFQLAINPQKGQIVHIDMPGQDTSRWPILGWGGSQYQLSFGPNRVVCGATREFDSGYDTRITPAGVQHVLDEQLRLCPGLADGTLAEVRVGLRPYSDDALPYIGTVPGVDNLVVGSGHGPSGLQLGPYSGLLAAELAQGLPPSADISSFRLDRPVEFVEVAH